MLYRAGLLLLLFFIPAYSFAAVSFSEVAWMGDVDSANHEWIELHNAGAAVDVSGWYVTDGKNLHIDLAGVIPPNTHVVLERTSDASAPGSAFLVYVGALVNSGATLQLVRADGSLEDQVHGGTDWNLIGGDNVTKETAQYTTAGWATAAPTPGAKTTETISTPNQDEDDVASDTKTYTSKKSSPSSESVTLSLPDVTLELSALLPEQVYVNQNIDMTAHADGVGRTIRNSLTYEWNFGDGHTATGEEVNHMYAYPGTYVVTLFAEFKRQYAELKRHVTVLPVLMSLTQNRAGDVQVNNDSPYEVEISGYRLKGVSEFVFPPRTNILANQTITVPKHRLGDTNEKLLVLFDTEGAVVASIIPERLKTEKAALSAPSVRIAPKPMVSSITYTPPVAVETHLPQTDIMEETEQETFDTQIANVHAALPKNERLPYVLLLVTIILAIFGIYLAPIRNK